MNNFKGKKVKGYEIYMGIIKWGNDVRSLDLIIKKFDKEVNYIEGSVNKEGNVIGIYFYGIFDEISFIRVILNNIRKKKGLGELESKVNFFNEFKDKEYDKLVDFLREYLDIEKIYEIMK